MYMNCKKSLSDGQESQRLRSPANGHSNSVMCPRLIIVRGRKCSPWRSPQWPFPSESHPTSTLWPLPFPPRPTTQWASYSNTSHIWLHPLDWLGCCACQKFNFLNCCYELVPSTVLRIMRNFFKDKQRHRGFCHCEKMLTGAKKMLTGANL